MKKIIAAACAAAFLLSAGCSEIVKTADYSSEVKVSDTETVTEAKDEREPLNYGQQVGMWLPYVKFPDYMQGRSEEDFRKAVREMLADAQAESVNTIYFHVRPNGDAYYASELFPKGEFLDGDYDPLAIVIDEAHKTGISVHAWINPLRLQTNEKMEKVPERFIVKKWINAGEPYVKNVNGRWFLDPSYDETVELITESVSEIIDNYSVDGIHIDDYFYPTTDTEFDREAFEKSGSSDLSQWRTDNVNRFVKAIYDTVKDKDERLVFGISPQGNIDADYNTQYADVKRWGSEEGFCDYIVPQIQFGFENENSPFLPTLAQWEEITRNSNVSLIIGLAAYKLGREDKWAGEAAELEWINDPDIIDKQINAVQQSSADGYALY